MKNATPSAPIFSRRPEGGWITRLTRTFRHLWLDAGDARRAVPDTLAEEWRQQVKQAEGRVGGEIRLCVEASLPLSYLWRIGRPASLDAVIRQRAHMMFGKLGVWDTERNTGVLIYVLLAEHAIEIVADRGLHRITPAQWQGVADELAETFRTGQQAQGLMTALTAVQALLASTGLALDDINELPDAPHLQ